MNDSTGHSENSQHAGNSEDTGQGGPGHGGAPDERQHVWDKPGNVKLLFNGFYVLCAILVVLDLVIDREEHHDWESVLAFYPLYGFVGIVVLVFIAKQMRRVLMRPEDYYDG